ncbi:hypothetical protein AK830_g707 [Neonectria ditissima]|uniref:F-box domain-containing protein n=1 Tax=Neonectria ditissima TaxID=78410 RepID=A0A0P7BVM5_9HYPO|nr:hypothetical protein AK830_g707 [Neonectria ditissima]
MSDGLQSDVLQTPQKTTLDKLPPEILRLICSLFCGHCCGQSLLYNGPDDDGVQQDGGIKALRILCETSHVLRSIAQPIVFHRITIPRRSRFSSILYILSICPHLAACVKDFAQGLEMMPETFPDDDDDDFIDLTDAARTLEMDSPTDPEFTKLLKDSAASTKFRIDLAIALCPNLTTMSLRVDREPTKTDFCYLSTRFQNLGHASLPQLRHLRFNSDDGKGFPLSNRGVRLIVYVAPNLEQLIFNGTTGFASLPSSQHAIDTVFPKLPFLRALEFHNCAFPDDARAAFIQRMIEHSPCLELFRYRARYHYFGGRIEEHLPGSRILKWLQSRQETFKYLDLNLSDMYDVLYPKHATNLTGKKLLAGLTNLQTLRLDETAFCSHFHEPSNPAKTCLTDILPKSLSVLVLGLMATSHVWTDLAELADQVADKGFPHLKHVKLYFNLPKHKAEEWMPSMYAFQESVKRHGPKLRDRFMESGVTLGIARGCSYTDLEACMLGANFLESW